MWDGGHGMDSAGVLWMVVGLAVLVLIVVGVVLLVRGLSERQGTGQAGGLPDAGPSAGSGASSALQVLEDRYARGEIDRKEFLQRKQDLIGG